MILLTRDEFRKQVFARDKNLCVVCQAPGQDAHHILERRLWPDSGYYVENGATLCGSCHIKAEQTILSCEEIRKAAGITKILLPPHFYPDEIYDKWGNSILPNGSRFRGELFEDESVQKILAPVLSCFTEYVKYPRTWHLPNSPGGTKDDRMLTSLVNFENQEVVVSLKMDGENSTLYPDYMHARSLDSLSDETRNWLKNFHSQIKWQIPEGWRLSGENLWAKHSIYYENLPSYFLLFSIWNDKNVCLSWDETLEWAQLMNIEVVPVLYRGIFNYDLISQLYTSHFDGNEMEGYVVRLASSFHYRNFAASVAKWVRKGHVQTSHHWRREIKVPNKLVKMDK